MSANTLNHAGGPFGELDKSALAEHLETLRKCAYSIQALARIAENLDCADLSDSGTPDWWGEWTKGGLMTAIESIAIQADFTIVRLQDRL